MSTETLTTDQLAARWDLSKATLARWRALKTGPAYVKLGDGPNGAIVYQIDEVKRFEKEKTIRPTRRRG